MRIASLCLAVSAALAAFVPSVAAQAERVPPRSLPLAEAPGHARVIVKFRDTSTTLRAQALSAGASSGEVASRLAARASALGSRHGLVLRAGVPVGTESQVVMADGIGSSALAARLAADPEVEYAEPDRRVRRVAVPNDPFFASVTGAQGPAAGQWYLRAPDSTLRSAINAVTAWDVHTGNPAVIVAVIDTGVRLNHPDLAGKLLSGYDFVSDTRISNDGNGVDEDPSDPGDFLTQAQIDADTAFWDGCEVSDSSWHGTQVSGIVAASTQNAVGMAGTGGHVRVLPVRALGKCFGYTSDIVNAMRWAAGLSVAGVPNNPTPAKVLNLSLGSSGACSQSETNAVAAVNAVGAVVVAAAGNSAGRASGSPANCSGAIGVAGLRHAGSKVGFSDIGPELSIAAPGGNCVNLNGSCLYPILTTTNAGTQGPGSNTYSDGNNASVGTSFSAPLVSGAAALMLSVRPNLTPAQLRSVMMSSARPFPASGLLDSNNQPLQACQAPGNFDQGECYCTTSTCGAGMLDASAAVRAAIGAANLNDLLQPAVALAAPTTTPQAGTAFSLTSSGSLAPRSIVSRRWSVVQSGGIVSAFDGASDGVTVTMTPSAAGRVVVQLALTDDRGLVTAVDHVVDVAAASGGGSGSGSGNGGGSGGGGGGGSMSWAWLLALVVATVALRAGSRTTRRAARRAADRGTGRETRR